MENRRPADGADTGHTMIDAIQRYWNEHIHDLKMTRHAVGTREFFDDLDDYRFDKLHYLPRLVDFKNGYKDRTVLEVGCGIGIDLLRFAQGGARVTGVDLAQTSIDLARKNFELHGLATNNGAPSSQDGRVQLRGRQRRSAAVPGQQLRRRLRSRGDSVHWPTRAS